jgi:hypothetical protein
MATASLTLPPTPQRELWATLERVGLSIPQFKALHEAVSLQRDGTAAASRTNHVTYLQHLWFAIPIMHHDAVKLDWSIVYPDLQESVPASRFADLNYIVIARSIHVRLAQVYPVCGVRQRPRAHHKYKSKNR